MMEKHGLALLILFSSHIDFFWFYLAVKPDISCHISGTDMCILGR